MITRLRQALAHYEFAGGCDFCRFQTAEGVFAGVKMTKFDRFAVAGPEPDWPREMEFSISNVCNLECVMCSGELSSAIRAHREKLTPVPRLYCDAVLSKLRPYLPYLDQAKFLGGEPFLVMEHFRLWGMMIENRLRARCHTTTNGTQYNSRVTHYLERLEFGFCLSLDAVTAETYERIRINASFKAVMANARRFREYAHQRHTSFAFGFCFMRQNWREFGDFCLMADDWDAGVALNTVRQPLDMAVYTLPVNQLREVLEGLERPAPELDRRLTRNRSVWFDEVERLRAKVCAAEAGGGG